MTEKIKNVNASRSTNNFQKFKGKTKIELFENGKKVNEITDNNMMTNMLSKVFNPSPLIAGTTSRRNFLENNTPIYSTALGGLLLYENSIEENADMEFAPVSNKCVGHAGGQYSGVQTTRGTLNSAESGYINSDEKWRGYRYVWDFGTDKANGTISCACLTSRVGGNSGFGDGINYKITENNNYFHISPTSLNDCVFSSGIGFKISNTNELYSEKTVIYAGHSEDDFSRFCYLKNKSQLVLIEIPTENAEINITDNYTVEGKVLDYNYVGKSGMTYRIEIYDLPFELTSNYNFSMFVENKKLYIVSTSSDTGFAFVTFDLENKSFSSVENRVITPAYYTQTNTICKSGNYWFAYSKDRKKLLRYSYDGGTGEEVGTLSFTGGRLQPFGDDVLVMSIDVASSDFAIFNAENPEMKFIKYDSRSNLSTTYENAQIIEQGIIIDFDVYKDTVNGELEITPRAFRLSPYLATINNLQTPITKTSAQTMKITYEVTPVEIAEVSE